VSEITDVIDEQVAAFRDLDLDRFLSCYAPDVKIYRDGQVFMDGIDVVREQYGQLFHSSPDLAVDIANRIVVRNVVVDEEHLRNFNMPGVPPNFESIVAYRVTDGKISQVLLLS
jgi:hypothetical protein